MATTKCAPWCNNGVGNSDAGGIFWGKIVFVLAGVDRGRSFWGGGAGRCLGGPARAPRASWGPRARGWGSCAPTARRYTRPARARRHDRARGSRMEQVCERVGALALLWLATAAAAAPLVWLARRAPPAGGAPYAVLVGGGGRSGEENTETPAKIRL